jgi:hypothetical protein
MNHTQNSAILAHLKRGSPLTPLEALRLYGCARLAARVCDLKAEGHDIKTEMVGVITEAGTRARVARYWMER